VQDLLDTLNHDPTWTVRCARSRPYGHTTSACVKFRDGAPEGIGCILGRNALNRSYVTGYGARASHRYYSR
jgi:Glycosyl hydrolase family 9